MANYCVTCGSVTEPDYCQCAPCMDYEQERDLEDQKRYEQERDGEPAEVSDGE